MSDKSERKLPHSISYAGGVVTINGVTKVIAVTEREAQLKLSDGALTVKGTGLNVIKLDREQGLVQLEAASIQSFTYRHTGIGFKGLFH